MLLQKIQIRKGDYTAPTLKAYYKLTETGVKKELPDDATFDVEDKVYLAVEAADEDGGSGLNDEETKIIVNGTPYDVNEPLEAGIYSVVFEAVDNAGNRVKITRTLTIYGDPVITIDDEYKEETIRHMEVADYDPMGGVEATDAVDGDLTDAVAYQPD